MTELSKQIEQNSSWTDSTKLRNLGLGFSVAMISPLNEAVRIGMLAGSEYVFNGNKIANALVVGIGTLAVEGSSGVVTSDLLTSSRANELRDKIFSSSKGKGIKKAIDDGKGSNLAIEIGTGLVAGTPVSLLSRELRNPKQTRSEKRKYALMMSIGTSSVVGSLFYGAEEGLGVNTTLEAGAGLIGLGIVFGGLRAAYKKIRKEQNESGSK